MSKFFGLCVALFGVSFCCDLGAMQKEPTTYYYYDNPTPAIARDEGHYIVVILWGDAHTTSLRSLIKRIHKDFVSKQLYIEARESDTSLIDLLDNEHFQSGSVFLHNSLPEAGWRGYMVSSPLVNLW